MGQNAGVGGAGCGRRQEDVMIICCCPGEFATREEQHPVTKIRYFGTYIRYLPTNPMSLQL